MEDLTMPTAKLPDPTLLSPAQGRSFLHVLEVYVDDFIQMAQTTDAEQLRHLSRSLLHGIHSVFPPLH